MADPRMLFLGTGDGGIFHYRTKVPAMATGSHFLTQGADGLVVLNSEDCRDDVDVVFIQMPIFDWQAQQILDLRRRGIKVLANVDDYLRSIRSLGSNHGHSHLYDAALISRHERCLAVCDGVVASTPWLANKMRKVNSNVYVCRNGLDIGRYNVERPIRDTGPVIGWSGGTGHLSAFRSIAHVIRDVMWENPTVQFVSVGEDFSSMVNSDMSLNGRCHHFRWSDMYYYPRNMSIFDISLAPSENNDFFRAKSQLRFYEAGALGSAPICSPMYDEVVEGVTGFIAKNDSDWYRAMTELVNDDDLRDRVSAAAKEYVYNECTADARAHEWTDAANAILCV